MSDKSEIIPELKMEKLQKLGISQLYATETARNATLAEAKSLAFDESSDADITVVGRIMAIRRYGKLIFCDLEDQDSAIQVIFNAKNMNSFPLVQKGYSTYDLIEVSGLPMLSKTNEPSIMATDTKMIAPCLNTISKTNDVGLRFTNRTADIIVNPNAKKKLLLRSKVLFQTRNILDKYGFLETTTPILQGRYGGGKSTPFISHCNSLDEDMFLRVTMDLYLKRIIAGGIERVYDIGKCFRNESICSRSNPEFTMLEAYGAYLPSSDMIKIVKEIVDAGRIAANSLFPDLEKDKQLTWDHINYIDGCKKYLDIDVSDTKDLEGIKAQCSSKGIDASYIKDLSSLHNKIIEVFLGQNLINYTVLTGFPVETSPLMHRNEDNPEFLDRAGFFANGIWFCDLAGELSDPAEQLNRLDIQKENLEHSYDNVDPRHIEALKLGCPFMSGIGFGVDRFLLALTKSDNLRENIPFPIAYEPMVKNDNNQNKNLLLMQKVCEYTRTM